MIIKKIAKESLVLGKIPDGIWAGSNIAEVFPATGDTRMSCGIHSQTHLRDVSMQLGECIRHCLQAGIIGVGIAIGIGIDD